MPRPGPYFPTLVDMREFEKFPFDFALYFSPDHADPGGIWLYLCNGVPTKRENWGSHDKAAANGAFDHLERKPEQNPIFTDYRHGDHMETPSANVINGKVYMTYHTHAGRGQSTVLAVSNDGIHF